MPSGLNCNDAIPLTLGKKTETTLTESGCYFSFTAHNSGKYAFYASTPSGYCDIQIQDSTCQNIYFSFERSGEVRYLNNQSVGGVTYKLYLTDKSGTDGNCSVVVSSYKTINDSCLSSLTSYSEYVSSRPYLERYDLGPLFVKINRFGPSSADHSIPNLFPSEVYQYGSYMYNDFVAFTNNQTFGNLAQFCTLWFDNTSKNKFTFSIDSTDLGEFAPDRYYTRSMYQGGPVYRSYKPGVYDFFPVTKRIVNPTTVVGSCNPFYFRTPIFMSPNGYNFYYEIYQRTYSDNENGSGDLETNTTYLSLGDYASCYPQTTTMCNPAVATGKGCLDCNMFLPQDNGIDEVQLLTITRSRYYRNPQGKIVFKFKNFQFDLLYDNNTTILANNMQSQLNLIDELADVTVTGTYTSSTGDDDGIQKLRINFAGSAGNQPQPMIQLLYLDFTSPYNQNPFIDIYLSEVQVGDYSTDTFIPIYPKFAVAKITVTEDLQEQDFYDQKLSEIQFSPNTNYYDCSSTVYTTPPPQRLVGGELDYYFGKKITVGTDLLSLSPKAACDVSKKSFLKGTTFYTYLFSNDTWSSLRQGNNKPAAIPYFKRLDQPLGTNKTIYSNIYNLSHTSITRVFDGTGVPIEDVNYQFAYFPLELYCSDQIFPNKTCSNFPNKTNGTIRPRFNYDIRLLPNLSSCNSVSSCLNSYVAGYYNTSYRAVYSDSSIIDYSRGSSSVAAFFNLPLKTYSFHKPWNTPLLRDNTKILYGFYDNNYINATNYLTDKACGCFTTNSLSELNFSMLYSIGYVNYSLFSEPSYNLDSIVRMFQNLDAWALPFLTTPPDNEKTEISYNCSDFDFDGSENVKKITLKSPLFKHSTKNLFLSLKSDGYFAVTSIGGDNGTPRYTEGQKYLNKVDIEVLGLNPDELQTKDPGLRFPQVWYANGFQDCDWYSYAPTKWNDENSDPKDIFTVNYRKCTYPYPDKILGTLKIRTDISSYPLIANKENTVYYNLPDCIKNRITQYPYSNGWDTINILGEKITSPVEGRGEFNYSLTVLDNEYNPVDCSNFTGSIYTPYEDKNCPVFEISIVLKNGYVLKQTNNQVTCISKIDNYTDKNIVYSNRTNPNEFTALTTYLGGLGSPPVTFDPLKNISAYEIIGNDSVTRTTCGDLSWDFSSVYYSYEFRLNYFYGMFNYNPFAIGTTIQDGYLEKPDGSEFVNTNPTVQIYPIGPEKRLYNTTYANITLQDIDDHPFSCGNPPPGYICCREGLAKNLYLPITDPLKVIYVFNPLKKTWSLFSWGTIQSRYYTFSSTNLCTRICDKSSSLPPPSLPFNKDNPETYTHIEDIEYVTETTVLEYDSTDGWSIYKNNCQLLTPPTSTILSVIPPPSEMIEETNFSCLPYLACANCRLCESNKAAYRWTPACNNTPGYWELLESSNWYCYVPPYNDGSNALYYSNNTSWPPPTPSNPDVQSTLVVDCIPKVGITCGIVGYCFWNWDSATSSWVQSSHCTCPSSSPPLFLGGCDGGYGNWWTLIYCPTGFLPETKFQAESIGNEYKLEIHPFPHTTKEYYDSIIDLISPNRNQLNLTNSHFDFRTEMKFENGEWIYF